MRWESRVWIDLSICYSSLSLYHVEFPFGGNHIRISNLRLTSRLRVYWNLWLVHPIIMQITELQPFPYFPHPYTFDYICSFLKRRSRVFFFLWHNFDVFIQIDMLCSPLCFLIQLYCPWDPNITLIKNDIAFICNLPQSTW